MPVVAAVLTLIGYSINDTIVVFDRIRENKKLTGGKLNYFDLINRSVNETLSRTNPDSRHGVPLLGRPVWLWWPRAQ